MLKFHNLVYSAKMPNNTDYSKQILLNNLRKGNADAFEQIFKIQWHRFFAIANSKLQSHAEAEEVIQGIFSAPWEHLLITKLTFYLSTALKNCILNLLRSRIEEKYWKYYGTFLLQSQKATDEVVVLAS
jgi:DNA-directed RNA polymerase specialized sigma24 family protein